MEGRGGEEGGTSDPLLSLEAQLKVQQICANIINYCRTAMTMGGKGQPQTPLEVSHTLTSVKSQPNALFIKVSLLYHQRACAARVPYLVCQSVCPC